MSLQILLELERENIFMNPKEVENKIYSMDTDYT